jgi:hypothetical protein
MDMFEALQLYKRIIRYLSVGEQLGSEGDAGFVSL